MKLEAKAISITFDMVPLLRDVDLSVASGEMVGLIGPNGSGKTTLLRVLAKLRRPDGGAVRLNGRNVQDIGERQLSKHIAYLAQGGDVHWPMRVDALVALGRLPHRQPFRGHDNSDRAAIERALVAADVGDFRHRTMAHLSGGERMRVLLARALAVQAALLLADEPVAALDPLHQLKVMELLHSTARAGTGVIVVLHDLSVAARFCDRLVLIARGGIVAQGEPPEVLTREHLALAYGVDVICGENAGIPYFLPRRAAASAGDTQ